MAKFLTQERLEIASVVIGGLGLLYVLFAKQDNTSAVGASVPVLIGSGGDSGGTGLSGTSGDGGATFAPITIPQNPPITSGSVYAPTTISTILSALGNPGSGCCAQSNPVPYNGVPPAQAQSVPVPQNPEVAYPSAYPEAEANPYPFGSSDLFGFGAA